MATKRQILDALKSNKLYLGNYYYLFLIQYYSGARISEVLGMNLDQVTDEGLCLIKGLKGSLDRVVSIPECSQYFSKCLTANRKPFFSMNRFTAYRLLKSIGIQKLKKNRKRESVTHIFRDNHSKNMRTLTSDKVTLKQGLGHKSINNVDFYGKD